MLKYKVEYETTLALASGISVEEYEQKYQEQQIKTTRKKETKLGYQLLLACLP